MYRIILELECKKCLHRFTYNMKSDDLATRLVICSNKDCKKMSLLTIADTETIKGAYRIISVRLKKIEK